MIEYQSQFDPTKALTLAGLKKAETPSPWRNVEFITRPPGNITFTPEEIIAAYRQNRAIAFGGDAQTADGQTVHTDGILGEAVFQSERKLSGLIRARVAHTEAKEKVHKVTGIFRRTAESVKSAQKVLNVLEKENQATLSTHVRTIEAQEKKINEFWKRQPKEIRKKRDILSSATTVKYFLENKLDLSRVKEDLQALGFAINTDPEIITPTVLSHLSGVENLDELTILLCGKRGTSPDEEIPGLIDFENNKSAYEENSQTAYEAAEKKLGIEETRSKGWENQRQNIKEASKTEWEDKIRSDRLTGAIKILSRVELPEGVRIKEMQDQIQAISDAREKFIKLSKEKEELAQKAFAKGNIVGQAVKGVQSFLTTSRDTEIEQAFLRQITSAQNALAKYIDPAECLKRTEGMSPELIRAVHQVNRPAFKLDTIYPEERPLYQSIMAFLGKTPDKVAMKIGADKETQARKSNLTVYQTVVEAMSLEQNGTINEKVMEHLMATRHDLMTPVFNQLRRVDGIRNSYKTDPAVDNPLIREEIIADIFTLEGNERVELLQLYLHNNPYFPPDVTEIPDVFPEIFQYCMDNNQLALTDLYGAVDRLPPSPEMQAGQSAPIQPDSIFKTLLADIGNDATVMNLNTQIRAAVEKIATESNTQLTPNVIYRTLYDYAKAKVTEIFDSTQHHGLSTTVEGEKQSPDEVEVPEDKDLPFWKYATASLALELLRQPTKTASAPSSRLST